MLNKISIDPNTTLYPVPVVMITCGSAENSNVFTLNRISSCNAEPPMLAISVRFERASHDIIKSSGEFVVNIPKSKIEMVTDFVGSTTAKDINKWDETGLVKSPALHVKPPLLDICPVNIECRVINAIELPSHTMFIGEVLAIHAQDNLLDSHGEIDYEMVGGGVHYRSSVVRERPINAFNPQELKAEVNEWRDRNEENQLN